MATSHIPTEILLKIANEIDDIKTHKSLRLVHSTFRYEYLKLIYAAVHTNLLNDTSNRNLKDLMRSEFNKHVRTIQFDARREGSAEPCEYEIVAKTDASRFNQALNATLGGQIYHSWAASHFGLSERDPNAGPLTALPFSSWVSSPRSVEEIQFISTDWDKSSSMEMLALTNLFSRVSARGVGWETTMKLKADPERDPLMFSDLATTLLAHTKKLTVKISMSVARNGREELEPETINPHMVLEDVRRYCTAADHLVLEGMSPWTRAAVILVRQGLPTFELSHCSMRVGSIPEGPFAGHHRITALNLHDIEITDSMKSIFEYIRNMNSLRHLRMSNIRYDRRHLAHSATLSPIYDSQRPVIFTRLWRDRHFLRDLFLSVRNIGNGASPRPPSPFEDSGDEEASMHAAMDFYIDNFCSGADYMEHPAMTGRLLEDVACVG